MILEVDGREREAEVLRMAAGRAQLVAGGPARTAAGI